MLIIFDLDDTLIDTSGSITPFVLKRALVSMVAAGLKVKDLTKSFALIEELDKKTSHAKETLEFFLKDYDAKEFFLEKGLKVLRSPMPRSAKVKPIKDAKILLRELILKHKLALVTIGNKTIQLEKMEKAGIDYSIFCNIVVCEYDCECNKGHFYKEIAAKQSIAAREVLVCGDRPEIDLMPAKNLGYKTVHFKNGRGRFASSEHCDYQIDKLMDIKKIIQGCR